MRTGSIHGDLSVLTVKSFILWNRDNAWARIPPMLPDLFDEEQPGRLARRLTGIYTRTLLWYFLAMLLLWVLGFESIYGHPTPFYALYSPAFDTLFVPGFAGGLMAIAWAVFTRRSWAVFATIGVLMLLLAALTRPNLEQLRALGWHLPALALFVAAFAVSRRGVGILDPSNLSARRFLAAVLGFSFLFCCAVAMLRHGFTGIAQAYQREAYEYVGDIGKAPSIPQLFTRYLAIMPYLSLHARAAPPGPIAVLWLLSYIVGRSAMALSLATIAVGVSGVVPLYYWARDLTSERIARTCCLVYVLLPSIVLFTATCAEALFLPFTLGTLFCFDRAIRRNHPGYAVAAGVGFACMSLLKFTLIGVGAYFAFTGIWLLCRRETRMNVLRTAAIMGASCLAVHLALRWTTGFDVIACFRTARIHFDMDQAKLDQVTPRLAAWVYRFLNPFCWFYFAGIPVSLLFLWRLLRPEPHTRALFIVFALTLFLLNLLYLGRGEGERSALYLFPFLALPAAHLLDELCARARSAVPIAATLAFLAFQCWLTEAYFYTYW